MSHPEEKAPSVTEQREVEGMFTNLTLQIQQLGMQINTMMTLQNQNQIEDQPQEKLSIEQDNSSLSSRSEEDLIFLQKLYHYDYFCKNNIVESQVSRTFRFPGVQSQETQDYVRCLVENEFNQKLIGLNQEFMSAKEDYDRDLQKFELESKSLKKLRNQKQDLEEQLMEKQKILTQLLQVHDEQSQRYQDLLQHFDDGNKELQKQLIDQRIGQNQIHLQCQVVLQLLNDNQDQNKLYEQACELQIQSSAPHKQICREYDQLFEKMTAFENLINFENQCNKLNQYITQVQKSNQQLKVDTQKALKLLNQLNSPTTETTRMSHSFNYSVSKIESLVQKLNDSSYRQLQVKAIQQKFDDINYSVKQLNAFLDHIKSNGSVSLKVFEAIKLNSLKKISLNQLNLDISRLESKLNSSHNIDTASKKKKRAKAQQKKESAENKQKQLRKLLDDKQARISQLELEIQNQKMSIKLIKQEQREVKNINKESIEEKKVKVEIEVNCDKQAQNNYKVQNSNICDYNSIKSRKTSVNKRSTYKRKK